MRVRGSIIVGVKDHEYSDMKANGTFSFCQLFAVCQPGQSATFRPVKGDRESNIREVIFEEMNMDYAAC